MATKDGYQYCSPKNNAMQEYEYTATMESQAPFRISKQVIPELAGVVVLQANIEHRKQAITQEIAV